MEAWHTKLITNADNNLRPLPGQYKTPFNEHS